MKPCIKLKGNDKQTFHVERGSKICMLFFILGRKGGIPFWIPSHTTCMVPKPSGNFKWPQAGHVQDDQQNYLPTEFSVKNLTSHGKVHTSLIFRCTLLWHWSTPKNWRKVVSMIDAEESEHKIFSSKHYKHSWNSHGTFFNKWFSNTSSFFFF